MFGFCFWLYLYIKCFKDSTNAFSPTVDHMDCPLVGVQQCVTVLFVNAAQTWVSMLHDRVMEVFIVFVVCICNKIPVGETKLSGD